MITFRSLCCALLIVCTLGLLAPAATANDALKDPSKLTATAPDVFDVTMTTSEGVILVRVHRDWAPIGADRFYNLATNGYFDQARFFRVVPNFVVQFGLSADPELNAVWRPARINDDPVKESNRKGTVTFATAGPNTRTTQIFINLKNNASLDNQGFAPFGEVIEGMDIVQALTSEYGQNPNQGMIHQHGNSYLTKQFPNLDYIETTEVKPVEAEGDGAAK